MLKAGVKPTSPDGRHAAVHAPEAELIRQHREELIEKIKARGVSQEQLVHELARGLVGKVTVTGPAGIESMAPFLANIPHAEVWPRPWPPGGPETETETEEESRARTERDEPAAVSNLPDPTSPVYCTDEDLAVRAGGDWFLLCPAWQQMAAGTDGVFLTGRPGS